MSDCLVSFVIQHHLSLFTVIPYCFLLCWVSGQQSHSSNDLWKWGSQCWAPTTQILPSHSTTWQHCTMIANSMTRQNHSMRGRWKYVARSGCVCVSVLACVQMQHRLFFGDAWVCVCMCANATQAIFFGMCGSAFACVQMQHRLSFSGCVGLCMHECKCNIDYLFFCVCKIKHLSLKRVKSRFFFVFCFFVFLKNDLVALPVSLELSLSLKDFLEK